MTIFRKAVAELMKKKSESAYTSMTIFRKAELYVIFVPCILNFY